MERWQLVLRSWLYGLWVSLVNLCDVDDGMFASDCLERTQTISTSKSQISVINVFLSRCFKMASPCLRKPPSHLWTSPHISTLWGLMPQQVRTKDSQQRKARVQERHEKMGKKKAFAGRISPQWPVFHSVSLWFLKRFDTWMEVMEMPRFGFGCWLLLLQSLQCTHRNRKEF